MKKHISILISLLVILGVLLTSCAAPEPETIIETVIVEIEGETVVETIVVEVVETVEVEKEVVVTQEVIVDPTECNLDAPGESVELNMIGWSFPITDLYAEELAKCDKVENLNVNTNLLASADAQEQVRLALSAGGDSPYDIVHGANAQVGEGAGVGWIIVVCLICGSKLLMWKVFRRMKSEQHMAEALRLP